MFTYLLQSSVCAAVFYAFYHWMLANQRYFQWNRVYLIGALFASLAIPWLAPMLVMPDSSIGILQWSNIMVEIVVRPGGEVVREKAGSLDVFTIIFWLYIAGAVLVFTRFIYGLGKILHYLRKGTVIPKQGYDIVETGKRHLPFSFYRYVFVDKFSEEDDTRTIIEHEKVHIRQNHTLDVIVLECFSIIFWFNPILRLYKRALSQVHECLADEAVCRVVDTRHYIAALLRKPEAFIEAGLGHPFYQSQIKQRLHMMTQINHRGKTRWVYLASVPVLAGLIIFFSTPLSGHFTVSGDQLTIAYDTVPAPKPPKAPAAPKAPSGGRKQKAIGEVAPPTPPTPPPPPPKAPAPGEPIVDEMPRYHHPECEALATTKEKENCAGSRLIKYVAENLVYPEAARKDSIEGMVVVQFIVQADGSMGDIAVIKDIGYGCGEAVKNVLKPLSGRKNAWVPGKDKGRKVSVTQTLPVRFKLN